MRDACLAVLDKAAQGDLSSFITLRDTVDGKPTQRVEVDEDSARELDLAAVMRLVLSARAASADEATTVPATIPPTVSVEADPTP